MYSKRNTWSAKCNTLMRDRPSGKSCMCLELQLLNTNLLSRRLLTEAYDYFGKKM
jgi:hypothetical protein